MISKVCLQTTLNPNIGERGWAILLKRVRRRCPAIILAARRTERVRGRINLLILSIRTIKGIRSLGVPLGTRWASIFTEDCTQPYKK